MAEEEMSIERRTELMMRASMRNWWEVVKDLDIPMPKTVLFPLNKSDTIALHCMTERPIPDKLKEDLVLAGDSIGYPLFLRTDQTSCKHDWEETCYVESRDVLFQHIHNLIDVSSMLGGMGLPTYALVFREFIPMDTQFMAFKGMPVNPERRYFAEGGVINCVHHYWVKGAIRFYGRPEPEGWQERLSQMNAEAEAENRKMDEYAKAISIRLSKCIGEDWSIDFCKGKDGVWYFIDCAPAPISWHPLHEGEKDPEIEKYESIFGDLIGGKEDE